MKGSLLFNRLLFLFLVSVSLTGCYFTSEPDFVEGEVTGYKPIYASEVDLEIALQPVRQVSNSGKIHILNDLVFLNEIQEGIHIIDNSNPSNPTPLGFLKIQGNTDVAIRDGILYANQYSDMLAIDFTDLQNPNLISRSEGFLANLEEQQSVPPGSDNYFECVDESKGRIISWFLTTLESPKCYK